MSETDNKLRQIIEGLLLAAGKPLSLSAIAEVFLEEERPCDDELREALALVADDCVGRGFELKEVASGYRLQVRQELSPWISRLWDEKPQRYTRALLETLALVAYRQPITRAEIESVRGVAVNPNILKTLIERNWVRALGHRDVPGHPELLGTTREFLDYFGLKRLDELPPLAELKDIAELDREGAELARIDLLQLGEPHAAEAGEQLRHRALELRGVRRGQQHPDFADAVDHALAVA